jgi:monofunctional glycosyltransferase
VTNPAPNGTPAGQGKLLSRNLPWPTSLFARHRDNLSRVDKAVDRTLDQSPMRLTALEHMVIMLEDRRFLKHCGIDLHSIIREISRAFTFRRFGGASTIEMQFVRTVTGLRQRTIWRKLYEAVLAIVVRSRYGKLVILRSYIACAFFGSGLIGADAAATRLFGKHATQLTLDEAAFIAAMLARPRPLGGPANWQTKVQRRAAYGLQLHHSSAQRNSAPLIGPGRMPVRAKAKSTVT